MAVASIQHYLPPSACINWVSNSLAWDCGAVKQRIFLKLATKSFCVIDT